MGKRGPKSKFTNVACPYETCKDHGVTGHGNIMGNGTYKARDITVRRYICHSCGKAFCDSTNTFYYNLRKDESTIDHALSTSIKGMSNEAVAEVFKIQPATVKRWLGLAAKQCDKVNATLMKNLNVQRIEMDELWVIIKKKVVPRMEVYEDNGSWMWVSFAPESRLIVAFTIGPRKQYVADELVKLTDDCLSENKPVFVTDGLNFYKVALLNQYGLRIEYPKTGKRGRPRNPTIVPSHYLRYAQIVKKRKRGKLLKVEKNVIFGKGIGQSKISTSLVERQNLTFRQDNNRVSRKTIGFSKIAKWLINQMKLYCTHFNFCRGHGGLKYKDERGVKCKNTPARAAGITDSKWTLRNLLTFKCFKTPII